MAELGEIGARVQALLAEISASAPEHARTAGEMAQLLSATRASSLPPRPPSGEAGVHDAFWSGAAYEFETLEFVRDRDAAFEDMEYGWRGFDPQRCQSGNDTWRLRDHPNLAFQLSETPTTGPDERVPADAMLAFLATYGPLTWSELIGPVERDEDLLLASKMVVPLAGGDGRHGAWAFQFSRPVALIKAVTAIVSAGRPSTIEICLQAVDLSPPGTLFRELLLQLLRLAIANQRPRRCAGCGRLFVTTEDASQAHHRKGWKRSDAKYHSSKCRHAHLERRRRARVRQTDSAPPGL